MTPTQHGQPALRVLSLGAGVQSTTLALLAGTHGIPVPDVAIFADTHAEPAAVYAHLERLRRMLSYPVAVVSAGSLTEETERLLARYGRSHLPTWRDGSPSPFRQCTYRHKIVPVIRETRSRLGLSGRRVPPGTHVEQWIGISTDEAHRMKPARDSWIVNRWPLIDLGWSRAQCIEYLQSRGVEAPRSSCVYCPFRTDKEWTRLRDTDPAGWAEALRVSDLHEAHGKHLHPAGNLRLVEIDAFRRQLNLWGNECEGMCGV